MTPNWPKSKYTTCPDPPHWQARILAKVKVDENGCWIWQGTLRSRTGYGRFGYGQRDQMHAPRAAYLAFKGDMPADHVPDHLCEVKACVNPDHLESVTHPENIKRGTLHEMRGIRQREATHCVHGHEFTTENTGTTPRPGRQGYQRYCRTCMNSQARQKRAERKARAVSD